jgi:steroid 5-alpha reductase family enzyme
MRTNWMKNGMLAYYIMAFTNVFMLQGFFSVIINSASLYTTIYTGSNDLGWPDYLGLALWIVGFTIEVVGDWQLKSHIAD